MQEGLTRNLQAFARFLEAASFSHGSVLNVSSVAREAKVDRKVVEGYFRIVFDLLLGFELPVFRRRAKRRMTVHPKFWFFDAGVYRALRPSVPLDRPEEIEGPALETLVLQEIRALNDYLALGYDLFFWRTARGQEVDFVLYGPRGLIAIEVKRTARIRTTDLTGLRSFRKDYPMARALMLYGGDRRRFVDGLELVPVEEALRDMETLLSVSPGAG